MKIHNFRKIFLIFSFVFCGFLFLNVSHAQAATLYYNNAAADNDWNTLASWWTDAGFTLPASSLPGSNDDVVITQDVYSNSGAEVPVNTIAVNDATSVQISVTVLNGATFNGTSFYQNGTLTGNAVFNGTSYFNTSGIITGSATYNHDAHAGIYTVPDGGAWFGGVAGSYLGDDALPITMWVFNGASFNQSTVPGDATFNGTSINNKNKTVNGNATFHDSSLNKGGTISGNATFYDSSSNSQNVQVIFHGVIITPGVVSGNATFYNSSFNLGNISGNAIFNDTSYNNGTITGSAIYNYAHAGVITIANGGRWGFGTAASHLGDDALPFTSWIFNGNSYNEGDITGNATYNDTSYNNAQVSGNALFFDSSINNGTLAGDVTFNNLSYNLSSIFFNATFNDWTYNAGTIGGDATFNHAIGGVLSLKGDAVWGFVAGLVKDVSGNPITEYIFNDTSHNNNNLTGNGVFYDTSYNNGPITGDACFAATAVNYNTVSGITTTPCPTLLPVVTTQVASSIMANTAILNADIISTGGEHPSERGFVYGTDPTLVTIIDTIVDTVGQPFTAGSFTGAVAGLTCNTTYYVKAYAINSIDTGFGAIIPFTTTACVPTVTTQEASSLTQSIATLNGNITSTGGANSTERGFHYGMTDSYGSNITQSSGPYVAGAFSGNALDLRCSTTYHYRAYATNTVGTSYGSDGTFTTISCPHGSIFLQSVSNYGGNGILKVETICKIGEKFSTTTGLPCISFESSSAPLIKICPITLTLRLGSRGEQVKCLQTGLYISSDGIFGPKTKVAVILYQKSKGLVPDGIFGPKSLALWK